MLAWWGQKELQTDKEHFENLPDPGLDQASLPEEVASSLDAQTPSPAQSKSSVEKEAESEPQFKRRKLPDTFETAETAKNAISTNVDTEKPPASALVAEAPVPSEAGPPSACDSKVATSVPIEPTQTVSTPIDKDMEDAAAAPVPAVVEEPQPASSANQDMGNTEPVTLPASIAPILEGEGAASAAAGESDQNNAGMVPWQDPMQPEPGLPGGEPQESIVTDLFLSKDVVVVGDQPAQETMKEAFLKADFILPGIALKKFKLALVDDLARSSTYLAALGGDVMTMYKTTRVKACGMCMGDWALDTQKFWKLTGDHLKTKPLAALMIFEDFQLGVASATWQ